MTVFRSEKISYLQILVPSSAAKAFVYACGKNKLVSFIDLQQNLPAFKKKFGHVLGRIENLQYTIKELIEIPKQFPSLEIPVYTAESHHFGQNMEANNSELETIEMEAREYISPIFSNRDSLLELEKKYQGEKDYLSVLRHLKSLSTGLGETNLLMQGAHGSPLEFAPNEEYSASSYAGSSWNNTRDQTYLTYSQHSSGEKAPKNSQRQVEVAGKELGFFYLSGVCPQTKWASILSQVQTLSKGNIFSTSENSKSGRTVFLLFVVGDSLKGSIEQLMEISDVKLYDVSLLPSNRFEEFHRAKKSVGEIEKILHRTRRELELSLKTHLPQASIWSAKLFQEKQVYNELNKLLPGPSTDLLLAEGWVPRKKKEFVSKLLRFYSSDGGERSPWVIKELPSPTTPPSYFPTNKYTAAFQNVVNAYDIPNRHELNPAAFSIFLFPFLAGVMFGDAFHGLILLLFTLVIIAQESRLKWMEQDDSLYYVYAGRYFLLITALSSIFSGALVNDFSSMRLRLFDKSFSDSGEKKPGAFYYFGVDWFWEEGPEESQFSNSLKMKLSLIIGIFHIIFGMALDCLNELHRKNWEGLFLQAVPQLVAFLFSFGYFVFLIYFKMLQPEKTQEVNLIKMLMNMFMFTATVEGPLFSSVPLENFVQKSVFLVCLASFLVILLGKPLNYLYKAKRSKHVYRGKAYANLDKKNSDHPTKSTHSGCSGEGEASKDKEAPDKEELVVEKDEGSAASASVVYGAAFGLGHDHYQGREAEEEVEPPSFLGLLGAQTIHTLEFGISLISHVASYLRLWAISLSHGELTKIVQNSLILGRLENPFVLCISSLVYGYLTLVALIGMGVFEAFLHALRLQWVEFMSKFFKGGGKDFEPFVLKESFEVEEM